MTPAQREALRDMLELTMLQAVTYAPGTGTRIRMDAKVDALRAALVERTCGTCQHADTEKAREGWCFCAAPMRPLMIGVNEYDRRYPFHHRPVPLDEGCKGWRAREGEG